jgi:hypothetical protein
LPFAASKARSLTVAVLIAPSFRKRAARLPWQIARFLTGAVLIGFKLDQYHFLVVS